MRIKSKVISSNQNVLGGAPVFKGTRVPLQALIDYLESGSSVQDFLKGFPTVSRKQVINFLEEAKEQFFAKV